MTRYIEIIETRDSVIKCDGGGGSVGHPAIYLNLGTDEKVTCPYCSRCFIKSQNETKTAI